MTEGVQSVERAVDLLDTMAGAGGEMSISDLATASGLPLPTIHRLIRTLVSRGYVRQLPSRRYVLGSRLIWLGEVATAVLGAAARPVLVGLVDRLGESANLAVLDNDQVTYVAHVAAQRSMRMFTEVGRHAPAHCTGVGKALLAQLSDDTVRALLARAGMPRQTPNTITDIDALLAQLAGVRRDGYAVDDGEQEVGVRCVAAPVLGGPALLSVSVSGPVERITPEVVARAVPLLQRASKVIAADLAGPSSS